MKKYLALIFLLIPSLVLAFGPSTSIAPTAFIAYCTDEAGGDTWGTSFEWLNIELGEPFGCSNGTDKTLAVSFGTPDLSTAKAYSGKKSGHILVREWWTTDFPDGINVDDFTVTWKTDPDVFHNNAIIFRFEHDSSNFGQVTMSGEAGAVSLRARFDSAGVQNEVYGSAAPVDEALDQWSCYRWRMKAGQATASHSFEVDVTCDGTYEFQDLDDDDLTAWTSTAKASITLIIGATSSTGSPEYYIDDLKFVNGSGL